MNTNFKAKVNGNRAYDISVDQLDDFDVIPTGAGTYHLIDQAKSYAIAVEKADFDNKTYTLVINNRKYEVSLKDDLDRLIKEMGFSLGAGKQVNSIKAPMPGLILDINASVGQEVKTDDVLLVLEAMKMENMISSPRDGIIKSIEVTKGDAIEKGALLIEFE
jgi:biotin carboxyl carrier protein